MKYAFRVTRDKARGKQVHPIGFVLDEANGFAATFRDYGDALYTYDSWNEAERARSMELEAQEWERKPKSVHASTLRRDLAYLHKMGVSNTGIIVLQEAKEATVLRGSDPSDADFVSPRSMYRVHYLAEGLRRLQRDLRNLPK